MPVSTHCSRHFLLLQATFLNLLLLLSSFFLCEQRPFSEMRRWVFNFIRQPFGRVHHDPHLLAPMREWVSLPIRPLNP
ncbi:hypothetical protein I7I48_02339 [Histoplasma ohiense]|nr:hypothetical protein I7I48_02339 [Histoplasma ohiense (nom. inval.)]